MDIRFELQIKRYNDHIYDVSMSFICPIDNPVLEMPSWTPGSYLIREYARHVQDFSLEVAGEERSWEKISKNNWKLEAKKDEEVTVSYGVYSYDLTVRTNYLDNRKGLLSPAATFMYIINEEGTYDSKKARYLMSFNLPEKWQAFHSLLPVEGVDGTFFAKDFDEIVDTPIALGVPEVLDIAKYDIDGKRDKPIPNTVVLVGDRGSHDMDEFVEDMKKIQLEAIRMFGELPYDRYLWALYIVGKGGGGLEHKYSNFSIIPRFAFKDPKMRLRLMGLEAHEHFHVYNIKRIRPEQLGPFDYKNEVYTKLLWVAEGITSFYDNLILVRSGIAEESEYLETIAEELKRIESIPGRKLYSLEQASFDAWIRLYRSDENTPNTSISYYLKGGIVAMCMDLEIRMQTDGDKSLDDVYRQLYEEYKQDKTKGFPEGMIQEKIEKITGTHLDDFFNKYIRGVEEIDINHYLAYLGYELSREHKQKNAVWTGFRFKDKSKKISYVQSNSPAINAGIYVDDEIVAIDNYEAKSGYDEVLKNRIPGDEVKIHLFRDGVLLETKLMLGEAPPDQYKIVKTEDFDTREDQRNQFFCRL